MEGKKTKPAAEVVRKWTNHYIATKEAFNHFVENDIFSDVCVFCDSTQFRCHRVVLAAGSEYFEHVFSETYIPASNAFPSVIIISRIRRDIFRYIIEYMYKGEVSVKSNDLKGFEDAALELKVRGIGSIPSTNISWTNGFEVADVCPSDFVCVSVDEDMVSAGDSEDDYKSESKSSDFVKHRNGRSLFNAPTKNAATSTSKALQEKNSNIVHSDGSIAKKIENTTSVKKRTPKNSDLSINSTGPSKPQAQLPTKRRRGPRPFEENVPKDVLIDILDTVSDADKMDIDESATNLVSKYQSIVNSKANLTSKPKSHRKRSSEEHQKLKADFEESMNNAVQDVVDKLLPAHEAAALYSVSVTGIRKRIKDLKAAKLTTSEKDCSSALISQNVVTSCIKLAELKEISTAIEPKDNLQTNFGIHGQKNGEDVIITSDGVDQEENTSINES